MSEYSDLSRMSKPNPFTHKWVGSKQKRAPRIPEEEWTNRKTKLEELYSTLTLPEVMSVVTDKNFNPSRKQFDYQFRKWGWEKYGSAKIAESDIGLSNAVPSHIPTVLQGEAATVTNFSRKRTQSSQSIGNCGSGFTSSPDNLSSKKIKVDNEGTALEYQGLQFPPVPSTSNSRLSTNDMHLLDDKEGDSDGDIISQYNLSSTGSSIHNMDKATATVSTTDAISTGAEASSEVKTPASAESGDFGTLLLLESIQSFKADNFTSASSPDSQTSDTISEDIVYHRHLAKAVEVVRAARSFSPRMLTSLLGQVNQKRLLSGADYLDAVWNKKRAFDIYRVLLNLEQANAGNIEKSQILSPIALSCARTAETPWQRDIVKKVLLRRMATSSNYASSSSETMLSHMLLAQMFALDQQHTPAKHHSESIQKTISGCDSNGSSFDLLAYLYHKKPEPDMTLQPGEKRRGARSIRAQLMSVNHGDFVRFALDLRYSSLSYGIITTNRPDPSTRVQEYVRSCIDWCSISIDCIVPGASSFTAWLCEEASHPTTSRWPETLALYNYLQRKWRRKRLAESPKLTSRWRWMDDSREMLGISAAELLIVCCDMVTHPNTRRSVSIATNHLHDDLSLRINFNKIQSESDEDLVTRFLQHLYLRAVPFIWATGSTVTGPGGTRESKYEPTIASSLRSSNLSCRMMKDAAASLVKRRFNVVGSDASLNSSRKTMASLAGSIDTMSDMMRDSLSISDTRERNVTFESNTSE